MSSVTGLCEDASIEPTEETGACLAGSLAVQEHGRETEGEQRRRTILQQHLSQLTAGMAERYKLGHAFTFGPVCQAS